MKILVCIKQVPDMESKFKLNAEGTWYDNADGTVRQHWEQSKDGGKSWTTAFDGLYKKKP